MNKRESFQQMVPEQLDIHMEKKNLSTFLTPLTKINSKQVTDLNGKCKITQFLEDNIGENLDDLGYGNDFLDITNP